jgi:ribose transport system substrate-binding protein
MTVAYGRRLRSAVLVMSALALVATACSKQENSSGSPSANNSAAAQQVASPTASAGPTCAISQYGATKFDLKTAKIGFSQSEKEDNPFRITETASIKAEAQSQGLNLAFVTNAQSQFSKQISDVEQMIAGGVQLLVIAPLNSDGWEPVLQQAGAKHIPIITVDRKINATVCKDYVTFIGSDFYQQGKRAADQMAKALNNTGKLAILLGASGNNVTTDRTAGFRDEIGKVAPGIQVVFQQTGNFNRQDGQAVTEQLIQSNSDIKGIYAENDEMGIGAETALKGAGKKPGDIKIVSVDGTRNAVQGIVDGWFAAVVESNPRFGPLAFQTAASFLNGDPIPAKVVIQDKEYDASSAQAGVATAY